MVFISYSSKDYDSAYAVKMMLQQNGIECWMAPESISMGDDYSNAIPQAIEVCDLFLLILSANSQGSKWVPKELDRAITFKKPIIPFQIDSEALTTSFNFMLSNIQRIEAFHDLEASYSKLLAHIKIETSTKQGNVTRSLIKSDEVSDKANGVFQDLVANDLNALSYSLIRKIDGVDVQLPELLSYYQLLGISDISQLSIERIRKQNDITISLSVPIGKDMNQEVVYLDLHQKGDGPNGVITGLAGTGKSEFLSTLCLSLCLFFSPEEIRLHIIDNFLPQKFSGLPHLGKCAHFEQTEIEDVIQTIDAEMQRRLRILKDNSLSNVYQYLKKRKKTDTSKEPMPHLILIIDDLNWLSQCHTTALDKLNEWGNRIDVSCLGLHIIFTNQVHHSIDHRLLRKFGDFKISSWLSVDEHSEKLKNYPGRIYLQSHARTKTNTIQLAYCGEVFIDEYIDSSKGFFSPKREDVEVIDLIKRFELD